MTVAPTPVFDTNQLLAAVAAGLIAVDAAGTVVFVNPRALAWLHRPAEAVRGRPLGAVLPGSAAILDACLDGRRARDGHLFTRQGQVLLYSAVPLQIAGTLRGALFTLRVQTPDDGDIAANRQLNRVLQAVFESSSDGLWVCDGHGTVLRVNRASARLVGVKVEEVLGCNIRELVDTGLIDRSVTLDVLATGRRVNLLQYVSRLGKTILVTGTPVFDADGGIGLVVVNERDMTQLNSIREELQHSRMVAAKVKDELTRLNLEELRRQEIVAASPAMREVLRTALKLARLEASNILLLGESGSGKGVLSAFIHRHSPRRDKPLVAINCAALPESLLEAELFGYERGAFTGARTAGKVGLFELAHEGTLFLDEIGDMPLALQAKLLKCLDDREIRRVGGLKPIAVDCTVMAATNRDLEKRVVQGRFRRDLFYRLNAFTVRVPPLRERPEDIFELATRLVDKYNQEYRCARRLTPRAVALLRRHAFPGNVRELKNLLKQAVVMAERDELDAFFLKSLNPEPDPVQAGPPAPLSPADGAGASLTERLEACERRILREAVATGASTRAIARRLDISQPSVVRKLKKYGLSASGSRFPPSQGERP